jgi:hypothetical protein
VRGKEKPHTTHVHPRMNVNENRPNFLDEYIDSAVRAISSIA